MGYILPALVSSAQFAVHLTLDCAVPCESWGSSSLTLTDHHNVENIGLPVYGRLHTDPGKSWKVLEFKIQIFQAWKVTEIRLGLGKSWKISHMVAAFLYFYLFSLAGSKPMNRHNEKYNVKKIKTITR